VISQTDSDVVWKGSTMTNFSFGYCIWWRSELYPNGISLWTHEL